MRTPTGNKTAWGRDFMIIGGAAGAAAPFFVILDPGCAIAGGIAGALSGPVFGAVLGSLTEHLRRRVSLPFLMALACVLGAVWGAAVGTVAGAGSLWFGLEGAPLGFTLGATAGMGALAVGYLPYLMAAALGKRALAVGAAVLLSPLLGWLGLAALGFSTSGLWLFAMPAVVALCLKIDRSHRALEAATALPEPPVVQCLTIRVPARVLANG